MSEIDDYMKLVSTLLEISKDPFAIQYKTELYDEMFKVANQNWLACGEPKLSLDQILEVNETVKNNVGDRSWELLGGINLNVN